MFLSFANRCLLFPFYSFPAIRQPIPSRYTRALCQYLSYVYVLAAAVTVPTGGRHHTRHHPRGLVYRNSKTPPRCGRHGCRTQGEANTRRYSPRRLHHQKSPYQTLPAHIVIDQRKGRKPSGRRQRGFSKGASAPFEPARRARKIQNIRLFLFLAL